MKHYTKESELKDILKQRRNDKRAVAFTYIFLGFAFGYFLAHFLVYLIKLI